jgi:hypothetical protein
LWDGHRKRIVGLRAELGSLKFEPFDPRKSGQQQHARDKFYAGHAMPFYPQ